MWSYSVSLTQPTQLWLSHVMSVSLLSPCYISPIRCRGSSCAGCAKVLKEFTVWNWTVISSSPHVCMYACMYVCVYMVCVNILQNFLCCVQMCLCINAYFRKKTQNHEMKLVRWPTCQEECMGHDYYHTSMIPIHILCRVLKCVCEHSYPVANPHSTDQPAPKIAWK